MLLGAGYDQVTNDAGIVEKTGELLAYQSKAMRVLTESTWPGLYDHMAHRMQVEGFRPFDIIQALLEHIELEEGMHDAQ